MDDERFDWVVSGLDYTKLTPWEKNFVASVTDFFEKCGRLSEKQEATLESIYKEKAK